MNCGPFPVMDLWTRTGYSRTDGLSGLFIMGLRGLAAAGYIAWVDWFYWDRWTGFSGTEGLSRVVILGDRQVIVGQMDWLYCERRLERPGYNETERPEKERAGWGSVETGEFVTIRDRSVWWCVRNVCVCGYSCSGVNTVENIHEIALHHCKLLLGSFRLNYSTKGRWNGWGQFVYGWVGL